MTTVLAHEGRSDDCVKSESQQSGLALRSNRGDKERKPRPSMLIGGFRMTRRACLAMWVVAVSMAVILPVTASASDNGTRVVVPEKLFSIEVPTGWTYDRNVSQGAVFFDLIIYGPSNGGSLLSLLAIGTWPWSGIVSDEAVYEAQLVQLDDFRSNPGISNLTFVSPPSNITVDGEKANRCNSSFQAGGQEYIMSGLVVVSDDWNMSYYLTFTDDYSDWAGDSPTWDQIIDSFHIEKNKEPVSWLTIGLLSAVMVAAVAAVVLLLLRRRRKSVQTTLPPLQEAVDEFFQEPSVIGPGEPRKPRGPPGDAEGPAS